MIRQRTLMERLRRLRSEVLPSMWTGLNIRYRQELFGVTKIPRI